MTFRRIFNLRALKYSFCLKNVRDRVEKLSVEEKRDFVIANYWCALWVTCCLLLQVYLVALGDNLFYERFVLVLSNEKTLFSLCVSIVGLIATFGSMGLRIANWKNLSEEKVLSEKIFFCLTTMVSIFTLHFMFYP